MEINYDKDFEEVMAELKANFGWSNVLPNSYKDLLKDTIRATKNIYIHKAISHGYHSAIALKSEDEAKSTFTVSLDSFCTCISRVGIDGEEHGKWICLSCKKEVAK